VTLSEILRRAEIRPHGVRLNEPDLTAESHSLAVTARGPRGSVVVHAMFNAYWEPLTFELPHLTQCWRRWVDTYRDAPDDVCEELPAPPVEGWTYRVQARSFVILLAFGEDEPRLAVRSSDGGGSR